MVVRILLQSNFFINNRLGSRQLLLILNKFSDYSFKDFISVKSLYKQPFKAETIVAYIKRIKLLWY